MSVPYSFLYDAGREFDELSLRLKRELNDLRRRVCEDPLHPPPPPVVKRLVLHPGFSRIRFGERTRTEDVWRAIYRFDNVRVEFWVIGPRPSVYRKFDGMHPPQRRPK